MADFTTITRKATVAAVLQAGGYVAVPAKSAGHPHLVALFNAAGEELPAWQTAIRANLTHCVDANERRSDGFTIYRLPGLK